VIRTYTLRMKVTRRQNEALTRLLAQLCELYNMALQQKRDVWKSHQKTINYYSQQAQLVELRRGVAEYAEFPSAIQRNSLRRVDRAFSDFFRRLKSGEKPGFPRFRSHKRYDSFDVDKANFRLDGSSLRIVKLGCFQTKSRCKIRGIPVNLSVKRYGNKWVANIGCDIGPAPEKIVVKSAIGIDLGVASLATLSDGTEIPNPRWLRQEEKRLGDLDRDLSCKQLGSKNREKSVNRLRSRYRRVAGMRLTYLTLFVKQLFSYYDLVAYEDLRIKELARGYLGKSIMDAAWGILIHRLKCEAEYAGKWAIPVDPRGTTKRCYGCGENVPKKIWNRVHNCPRCGLSLGRDHNAALNVLRFGESLALKQNCVFLIGDTQNS
jgi:putative transposase